MTNAQFLIAKYIPDLQRLEPRNVGVIVWTPDGLAARFLAEYPERPGEVDGRRKPEFFSSLKAYRQWVRFWRRTMDLAQGRHADLGVTRRAGPEVLEELKDSSKGNFVVVDGGFLLDPVPVYELPRLSDHLFSTLVAPQETAARSEEPSLEQRCRRIFASLPVPPDVKLLRDHPIHCQVGEVDRVFRFDYVLKNGTVRSIYEEFALPHWKKASHKKAFWSRVDATAYKFDKVIAGGIADRSHTATLILAGEREYDDPDVSEAIKTLNSVSHVVNVADMPRAAQTVERLAVG